MSDSLYPTFPVPEVVPEDTTGTDTYRPSPLFDFEKGDFVRDGANRVVYTDGRDAYKMWVFKTLNTQLGACLPYPGIGIDYDGALASGQRSVIQAELERAITEGLLRHAMTQRVKDFVFTWRAESLYASFTVQGINAPAFNVNMQII